MDDISVVFRLMYCVVIFYLKRKTGWGQGKDIGQGQVIKTSILDKFCLIYLLRSLSENVQTQYLERTGNLDMGVISISVVSKDITLSTQGENAKKRSRSMTEVQVISQGKASWRRGNQREGSKPEEYVIVESCRKSVAKREKCSAISDVKVSQQGSV